MRHLSATMRAKTTLWMCVALAAAIVAAWLVVLLGTPTKPAEAAFPGNNGKIAFASRLDCCDLEIFTMKANGDNKTVLTNNGVDDFDPAFSPNGRKIAFASTRAGNSDIYTMSANGTNKKQVTTSKSPDFNPAWSPDGTRIAFVSERHGNSDIYVINKDGTGLTRLTTSTRIDNDPAWSPDGSRIAFKRGIKGSKIYVMKAVRESETNRPQRLTTTRGPTINEWNPAWSPDGSRIAFVSDQAATFEGEFDIYSIGANGSGETRLTTTSRGFYPAWSPDGTKIAFSGEREGDSDWRIYVMNAAPESETNPPKPLTGHTISLSPDWQPLR